MSCFKSWGENRGDVIRRTSQTRFNIGVRKSMQCKPWIKINKNKKHLHKTWVIRSVAITQLYIPVGKSVSPVTYFRKLVCWDRKTHSIIWRAGAFILKIKTRTDPRILSKRPRWSAHRVYQTLWSNRCNTTAPPGSRGSTQNNIKSPTNTNSTYDRG